MKILKKAKFIIFIILLLPFAVPFTGWQILYEQTSLFQVLDLNKESSIFLFVEPYLISIFTYLDWYFIFLTIYSTVIGVFGFWVQKLPRIDGWLSIPPPKKCNNFVLLMCAHNEDSVIRNSLEQMMKTNYPHKHLRIVVVCDNCEDNTFQEACKVAKLYPGIIVVLERKNKELRGKPYAVKFGLEWINHNLPNYDALSIADADNVYDRDFFDVMNYKINNGSEIIQGYLGVKNPYDSFVSASGMYTYCVLARFFFAARQNLGMSTTLGGTGFVITKKAIDELKWDMKSLVEDFEFSTKAVIHGKKIDFAYDAITYDEKPTELQASIRQRSRWQKGHWNVAFRMTPRLIAAMIFRPTKIHWPSAIDYFLYLWSPGRILLYIWFLLTFILILYLDLAGSEEYLGFFVLDWEIRFFIIILPRILEYIFAVMEGFDQRKILSVFYYYTVFFVGWIPGSIIGLFTWPFQGNWDKTAHKVKFSLEKETDL